MSQLNLHRFKRLTRMQRAGLLACTIGFVVQITGGMLSSPVIMMAGLAVWVLLVMGLAYVNRIRLNNHMQFSAHAFSDMRLSAQRTVDALEDAAASSRRLHGLALRAYRDVMFSIESQYEKIGNELTETRMTIASEFSKSMMRLDDSIAQLSQQNAKVRVLLESGADALASSLQSSRNDLRHAMEDAQTSLQSSLSSMAIELRGHLDVLHQLRDADDAERGRKVELLLSSVESRLDQVAQQLPSIQSHFATELQSTSDVLHRLHRSNLAKNDEQWALMKAGLEKSEISLQSSVNSVAMELRDHIDGLHQLGDAVNAERGHKIESLLAGVGSRLDEVAQQLPVIESGLTTELQSTSDALHRLQRGNLARNDEQWLAVKKDMDDACRGIERSLLEQFRSARSEVQQFAERMETVSQSETNELSAMQKKLAELQDAVRLAQADFNDLISNEKRLRKISQLSNQWLKTETVKEVESLMRLQEMFDIDPLSPLLGGWAMDPAAMLALVDHISSTKPERVLELGSGVSTMWIAMALKRNGRGKLISIDHLDKFADRSRAAVALHGLQDVAEIRVAHLQEIEVDGNLYDWYDPKVLEDISGIDLLLVDGPPGGTGPLARYPAIPLLRECLTAGAIVVVDDSSRPDEAKMMRLWKERHPALVDADVLGARTQTLRFGTAGKPSISPSTGDKVRKNPENLQGSGERTTKSKDAGRV